MPTLAALRTAGTASSSAPPPTKDATHRRRGAPVCVFAAAGGASTPPPPPSSSGGGRNKGRKQQRIFEVVDASPPPRSLGEHPLPPDTHNGDRIEAAGGAWVVQRTALHYRLVRGRYVRHAARVEVVSAGRFLVERYLTGLMEMPGGGSESGGGGGGGGRERK